MNPELKGAYKEFLESEVGKDFLKYLVGMEVSFQAQGIQSKETNEKAWCLEKIGLLYQIRTSLDEMSKIPAGRSVRSGGPQV